MEITVDFPANIDDKLFKYAVIVARYPSADGKYVFVKHRNRDTLECPGGHREIGESIEQTAGRELFEETGAVKYTLKEISPYSVTKDNATDYGMLYFAEVTELGELPPSEIERVVLLTCPPENAKLWTYPMIQPVLLDKACSGDFLAAPRN